MEIRISIYRPITCLNTGYKLFTAVITSELRAHCEVNNILPHEQKALQRGQRGCLDTLMVDAMILESARVRYRNLSVAWIDYKKAYDRVPHDWVERILNDIKAPRYISNNISNLIPMWSSRFELGRGRRTVKVNLQFRRGLFQGDSLLFCLSIAPLSSALRYGLGGVTFPGFKTCITHLLYMDDLKVYATGRRSLEHALSVMDRASKAVGMELGPAKCAEAHLLCEKPSEVGNDTAQFRVAEKGSPYTYF